MIRVNIGGKRYKVKTKWSDVKAIDLYNIGKGTPKEIVEALTNIPKEVIDRMTVDSLLAIVSLTSFIDDLPDRMVMQYEIDIAKQPYGKVELFRQLMTGKSVHHISFEACRIFFGLKCLKWKPSKIYGQSNQILHSLSVFLERFKDLHETTPYTDEQIEAGVKALESFGVFGVIDTLAEGDLLKHEGIENLTAEKAYLKLLFEKAKNDYNKNLEKIHKRQNGFTK